MNQWLGNEGFLQGVFARIWDMTVLNLCFLAGCVPVVTIGASLSALYSVNLKLVRREEGVVFVDFWRAFRANFRQGTALWAIVAGLGALLLIYLAALPWVFAYGARFADDTKTVLRNALILTGANLPVSAAMLCLRFVLAFVSLYSMEIFLRAAFVWVVLGFATVNMVRAYLLRRVFDGL